MEPPRLEHGDQADASLAPRSPQRRYRPVTVASARVALAVYAVILLAIAIWPVPVDSGAGPALRSVTRLFPLLTYQRIEFGANVLLFVPLGALLAVILVQRALIIPIAVVVTVAIESVQAIALEARVPSLMDIVANLTGACVGLLLVALLEWTWRPRPQS
jgi:VanZ family protein